jgi:hypothetical protein
MKKVFAIMVVAAVAVVFSAGPVAAQHAAVGADKCAKMCHKVEFTSWSASKHATGKEKVDCEACHGNGADYMKLSVMKDPAKAKEAGLITPTKASCTAKCHKPADITDAAFANVHEKKKKA